jgi:hypothetical protein
MANRSSLLTLVCTLILAVSAASQSQRPIVLRAARLLDVRAGRMLKPAEILIQGDRIVEVGASVKRPAGVETIDLGDRTLLPGLIDAHIHLFLHPGAEDLQSIQESVPERTIMATLAARDDLVAGFTAERDMGTEGAGSADTAVRNAINEMKAASPDRACASAGTPSIFSADTRTPSATTLSNTSCPTQITPIMPTNWSRSCASNSKKARTLSRSTRLERIRSKKDGSRLHINRVTE